MVVCWFSRSTIGTWRQRSTYIYWIRGPFDFDMALDKPMLTSLFSGGRGRLSASAGDARLRSDRLCAVFPRASARSRWVREVGGRARGRHACTEQRSDDVWRTGQDVLLVGSSGCCCRCTLVYRRPLKRLELLLTRSSRCCCRCTHVHFIGDPLQRISHSAGWYCSHSVIVVRSCLVFGVMIMRWWFTELWFLVSSYFIMALLWWICLWD